MVERIGISPDAKRLLGLRDFPHASEKHRQGLLGSNERAHAWEAIDTSTLPRRKREVKKGIVLETLEKT